MSPSQWIELIDAKGIITKNRANGGTFAQYDIAIKFVSLVSVELYLVKELQRPKADELKLIVWTAKRELFKINYRIHTYAIKNNFIPTEVIPKQTSIIYADEADVSNVAMFCMTAKMWIEQNPDLKGKIRDYVSINELVCISNMESLNAVFIGQDIVQC